MLAKRKKQLNSSQNDPYPSTSSSSSNGIRKSLPANLSGVTNGSKSVTIKREEKDISIQRRYSTIGSSAQPSVVNNSALLNEMIPRMKDTLFSTDCTNVQKSRELKRLIILISEWGKINDQTMIKLLENLKENVESLDDKMTTLVHQVLDSNWCSRQGKVVQAFEDFLSELLVIRPFYAGAVLQSLVRKFLPFSAGDPANPNEIPIVEQRIFDVAHRNLKKLLHAFPRMRESCLKNMGASYPYMLGRSPFVHYCYVVNLLSVIKYSPVLKTQILQLIIHKLCRIDVNIPRDDAESLHDLVKDELTPSQVKTENGKISLDVNFDREQVINSLVYSSKIPINPLVNILDICLHLVFECLQSIVSECSDESELDSFYESMFDTFEREVLPSYGVHHVQFLYFYLISVEPSYCQKFLDFLWKKFLNLNTPAVFRIQFMSYIAGILARGNFVSVKILKRWLVKLCDWANSYVDQRESKSHWSHVNIQAHGPFYALCQAVFYVFAFRNKDLIGSKKCTAFTGTLNLGRLVTCDLNPLKAVVGLVAKAFVNAAHVHQISYCRTVLERNQRATIPTAVRDTLSISTMDTLGTVDTTLESFFPFDPFVLPRSRKWIDPTYRVYERYLPEVKIEKREDSSPHNRPDEHNEDSIDAEMDLSSSFRDRDCSHFITAGLMDTSDLKDEFMDQ